MSACLPVCLATSPISHHPPLSPPTVAGPLDPLSANTHKHKHTSTQTQTHTYTNRDTTHGRATGRSGRTRSAKKRVLRAVLRCARAVLWLTDKQNKIDSHRNAACGHVGGAGWIRPCVHTYIRAYKHARCVQRAACSGQAKKERAFCGNSSARVWREGKKRYADPRIRGLGLVN